MQTTLDPKIGEVLSMVVLFVLTCHNSILLTCENLCVNIQCDFEISPGWMFTLTNGNSSYALLGLFSKVP